MTESSHAVFLSYASQDAPAARRICEALRAAGVEVWFDQSELRGGDVWDQKIRREIRDCALFIPIISANTAARHEGYFRLEWDLADQRTHMMARNRVFIVPVCVDGSSQGGTDVPESFERAQWMRLPAGETPPAFVERVLRLLSPGPSTTTRASASGAQSGAAGIIHAPVTASRSPKRGLHWAVAVAVVGLVAFFVIQKFWISKPAAASSTAAASAPSAAFTPPPHSVAVLPFVNMSGDKEQQYFSDGLTEELLNSLTRINQLQVAAPTSSFTFQGEHPDVATVAHRLNVGAVLEGSVRRSGNTVRITTQLINAVTGFHLWSQTYDRDLEDVLKLQTEIATAVAGALKVTLLGDEAARIELGGTHNPAAFDAYLRGSKAFIPGHGASSLESAIASYTEAIRLDPNYALAFAGRSRAFSGYAGEFATGSATREFFDKGEADARQAIKLAPELAEAHLALAQYLYNASLDFTHANESFERAMALAPGNAQVLREAGRMKVLTGRSDAGLAAVRRAVELDPLNPGTRHVLGLSLYFAHGYEEAVATLSEVISLDHETKSDYAFRGLSYYWLADLPSARSSCEIHPDYWSSQWCLAVVYDKLGRHADAQAELEKMKAANGDSGAFQYATIYAQWGDTASALEWLATAVKLRDPGLVCLRADPLLDPLRKEPRFQAIERELKFSSD